MTKHFYIYGNYLYLIKYLVIFIIISLILYSCKSVRMTEFNASDCKSSSVYGLISKKKSKNNTIIIYGISEYCCRKFTGNVKYKNDTLFLKCKAHGRPCRCFCSYELTYVIKGLDVENYKVVIVQDLDRRNKRRLSKSKKLNDLRTSNPEKYHRKTKKRRKFVNFLGNISDRISESKRNSKENIKLPIDDVY